MKIQQRPQKLKKVQLQLLKAGDIFYYEDPTGTYDNVDLSGFYINGPTRCILIEVTTLSTGEHREFAPGALVTPFNYELTVWPEEGE